MSYERDSGRRKTAIQHSLSGSKVLFFLFQFLKKAAFPSRELQNRNEREAQYKTDKELRKKSGGVKDIRIHLKRINPSELKEDFGKASTFKWKVTRTEKWKKMSFCPYTKDT